MITCYIYSAKYMEIRRGKAMNAGANNTVGGRPSLQLLQERFRKLQKMKMVKEERELVVVKAPPEKAPFNDPLALGLNTSYANHGLGLDKLSPVVTSASSEGVNHLNNSFLWDQIKYVDGDVDTSLRL